MTEVELQQVGPYAVMGLLGVSPTCSFYQGKQRKKNIIIKRLHVALETDEAKELFLARGKQLKKLKNRLIANTLDAGFDGDYGYLVTEDEPGESLRQQLAPGERVAPNEVMRVLAPVAEALRYVHVNNTLHGNLHPGNLLLIGPHQAPLLTEFALTVPGMHVQLDNEEFAIPYMAPEHLRHNPEAASDQYALAVMVYEWLCGQRPYDATERELLLQQQEQAAIVAPSKLNEAVSPELERVLLRALDYEADKRFPTVQDFSDEFLRVLKSLPPRPVEVRPPTLAASPREHTITLALPPETVPITPALPAVPVTPAASNAPPASRPPQADSNGHAEGQEPPTDGTQDQPDWDTVQEVRPALASLPTMHEKRQMQQNGQLVRFGESTLQQMVSADLFQGGVLSQSLPGYEERLAQIEMATLVARSLTQNVPAIIEAGTGTGKALDVETPIPTPSGWKRMGELIAGDTVFDEQGQPTRVTTAFDVLHGRPCYEVVFSDGSSLIADAEHEWASYTDADRTWSGSAPRSGDIALVKRAYTLVTTAQIAATLTVGASGQANHAIAVAGPLALPETVLPVDPYILHPDTHIPKAYLRASQQQRRALLAGLLDADGTINEKGVVEFSTIQPQLAQDMYELVCSLGLRASLRQGKDRLNGKWSYTTWTLTFTTEQQVFRREDKIIAHQMQGRNASPQRNRFRSVVAVRKVPSRPVRCIQVDAPSHLYLAGRSMIPTHNSLAYLVPIVRSGKVAIVSTANKALQEQLFYKDIPFVQQHVKHFEAALVKGVGNYICLERVENERIGMQALTKNLEFKRLLAITQDPESTFNGDFETLGFPLPSDIRGRIATDSDQCAWSKCDFYGDCYVRQMRERAEQAKVIVVNHTLLLLDALMGGFLLPERDVIVLDEAHHLEEEATRSFTVTIGPAQIQTLLAQRLLKNHSQLSLQDEATRISSTVWTRLALVADPGFKGRANLEQPLEEGLRLATVISDLADSLRRQRPKDMPEKESQLYDKLLKRTQNLSENIRIVFSVAQPEKFVYYVERVQNQRQRDIYLQASAAPLDVTSWLRERLFDKCNIICTSATLATIGPNPTNPEDKGPNFGYFRRRVGLAPQDMPNVLEKVLPLAFDYESNALLYIPRDLPVPDYGQGSDEYMKSIAREMYRLVKASRGRAFLLFSSKRMLDRAHELMSPHLPYPLLKQGDMTRLELTRRFREEEGSVLFGLKSFWEGVDIAGEALSLVVIDKLPFDPPDDPVHEARVAQMKAAGENWFGTYVLPQAVLRLKQGLGRLLRTRDDRGVMAILDARIHTKGYGKLVLNGLPPARRTTSMRDVERFFNEE